MESVGQSDLASFLGRCLLLDLEAKEDHIYRIGAVYGQAIFERKGSFDVAQALAQLDVFSLDAEMILGHNLLAHDLPILKAITPRLELLRKPVIDTLYLSALAFPENPYHRLVKDYKLVRESLSDPVADARLAASVFEDQWKSFERAKKGELSDLLLFYRHCFEQTASDETANRGFSLFFESLGAEAIPIDVAARIFRKHTADRACLAAFDQFVLPVLQSNQDRPALSYGLAWLRVAGSNSVLPPWVRHRFPILRQILRHLRDVPCADPGCTFCRAAHDPLVQLKRYFGYRAFRSSPAGEDRRSLQEHIVRHAMGGNSLLAILPTGGGKSLCYQLPALVHHYRRGVLSIVISPLQALMKDQVDNLAKRTGTPYAAALSGLLTPPERGEVLEQVRLGDVALLYVAPEQLRNRSFRQAIALREIGAWVFDEAHCLSKWGHDFRPDYLYAGRFIREFADEQGDPPPPVFCFTATAKPDVRMEIIDFFRQELGQTLSVFEGGVERENLRFEVRMVKGYEKNDEIQTILSERLLIGDGAAVVYTRTRKGAERVAEFLKEQGWAAAAFHAGLNAAEKRTIQDGYLSGELKVIAATNAFGMGIDKEDIRLVLHADVPGSLENYLQEAGRAGRDLKDADCVLLYEENDVEDQFRLGAWSEISRRDIAQILRGIRRAKRNQAGEIVLTAGDLLLDDEVETSFDAGEDQADTKVKTAVAWLERAGFLLRDENNTRVFQGRPSVRSMEEAKAKIKALHLSSYQEAGWLAVFQAMMNAEANKGLRADELAELPFFQPHDASGQNNQTGAHGKEETASTRVIRTLHSMAEAGLVEKGLVLTAFVRHKVQNPPVEMLKRICTLEESMLNLLQEEAQNMSDEGWNHLSLQLLNQRVKDLGHECTPAVLRGLFKSLSMDGKGLAGSRGSLIFRHVSRDQYWVKLLRNWEGLVTTAKRRMAVASVVLDAILSRIPAEAHPSAELLVEFSVEDLTRAIRSHIFLRQEVKDPLAAADRALLYLHEQKIIILQQGLSVFRQAMTIRILPDSRKGRYLKGDYEPLALHYKERIFQVHVINEYARLGLQKIRQALDLVLAYFSMPRSSFIKRFFPDRREMLDRATSLESFRRIVDDLKNPVQMGIVAAPAEGNMLILAGPGSGKTRVVVHRCAYLLRVLRVPGRSILVVCFNHHAAVALKRRLFDLVGNEARGVIVATYHGLAMILTGTSFYGLAERARGEGIDFDALIHEAIRLLRGEVQLPGLEADELRDRLLAGFRHILVDEYQDIDGDQYELISALAGRTEKDPDCKLSILAVGDDDQNIYTFRGANVEFIRRFQGDYDAQIHYLTWNYRSTANIINAANSLIKHNRDRMKIDYPIVINKERKRDHPGGAWSSLDTVSKGRVQMIEVGNEKEQISAFAAQLARMMSIKPALGWSDFAVLARTRELLHPMRAMFEKHNIPFAWTFGRETVPPLHHLREIARFMNVLEFRGEEQIKASEAQSILLETVGNRGDNPWWALLMNLIRSYETETSDAALPKFLLLESLHGSLHELRREQPIGNGVFLGTIHGAKGTEFLHVFMLDGGWRNETDPKRREEERRIFYVGMTRAQQTLSLFRRRDIQNPYMELLSGDSIMVRQCPALEDTPEEVMAIRYEPLSLADLYISYAGKFEATHVIHSRLSKIGAGTELSMRRMDDGLGLIDAGGFCIARLSRQGALRWTEKLDKVKKVRVIGMIQREKRFEGVEFRDQCLADRWEVPWVEVVWTTCKGARP